MATNSYIGKEYGGIIKAVYCHYDGDVAGVGEALKQYYTHDDVIDKLINLGDLSYLGQYVGPKEGQPHDFNHPAEGVTVAYHRDRGESLLIKQFGDETEYSEDAKNNYIKYVYLWKNGTWLLSKPQDEGAQFKPF